MFAITLDTYNGKEHIICQENNTETEYVQELGAFLLDFPDIFNDNFYDVQRHLKLNARHSYSSLPVLEQCCPELVRKDVKINMFYRDDMRFFAIDTERIELLRYYLDELYAANLFPRRCINCNTLFVAKSHLFDVLCSDACKKQKTSEKLIRYKERHDDEYEAQYMKVYQRWYTRIRRLKIKGLLTGNELILCNSIFSDFTSKSFEKRNSVRNGNISPEIYNQWLNDFDSLMNMLLVDIGINDKYKRKESDTDVAEQRK